MPASPRSNSGESNLRLNVWLINPYVNLPGEDWRAGRSSLLAYELSRRGHNVTLWTGNISHRSKTIRSTGAEDREVQPGYTVRILPSTMYRKNIGLGRLVYETVLAWRIWKQGLKTSPPDIVVAHDPPQVNGAAGYRLARHFKVPLIIDTVDLWPEFWIAALPKPLSKLGHIIFAPFFAVRLRNWKAASGYTTLAKPYMDVVQQAADPGQLKPFCVAYNGIDVKAFRESLDHPKQGLLPERKEGEFRAVFAGTLGPSYDLGAIITAAEISQNNGGRVRFVLAGDGPMRDFVEAKAAQMDNLLYLGKLPPNQLPELYSSCDVGLSAYSRFSNVEMPDKFYDYIAAGLPVVSSLTGEVQGVIEREHVGLQYEAGNGESLYSALCKLECQTELRLSMGKKGWNLAMEYDNDNQICHYADLVEKVAKG